MVWKLHEIMCEYKKLTTEPDFNSEDYQYRGNDSLYIYPVYLKKHRTNEKLNLIVEKYNSLLNKTFFFGMYMAALFLGTALILKLLGLPINYIITF